MKISGPIKEYLVAALYLSAVLGLILFVINRDLPKVGHDYGFFIPRMLDTHLHHRVNGTGIQWYTANFGGGTPAYPNPQYLQYSLPQFFMFTINPWLALMLSLTTYALLGFAGFYAFLREEMGWVSTASALGASFILANGFFVEHAIVGHVGFQHFPLLGAILFLLFSRRLAVLPAGIMTGLLAAMILNQAGFIILIIFAISLLLLLPLIYLSRSDLFNTRLVATLATGGLVAALLSISKVSAVMAFMRFFPRVIEDDYGQTYLQGIAGMVRQVAGFNFIVPYLLFTGRDIQEISAFFQEGAGAQFGPWEMNMVLSPGLLLLLILGLGLMIHWLLKSRPGRSRGRVVALLVLCLGIWLTADLTLAQGGLYGLLKPLPVLRSLHANVRFTSALIFPLAFLGALVFHKVFKDKRGGNLAAFPVLGIATLAMLSLYLVIPEDLHIRSFNLNSALPVYAQIDNGWNFTLQDAAEITDIQVFVEEDSNLTSQDPMFGYEGEYFSPKMAVGPILQLNDGYYNMTNPAGYVFPGENNLQPFDLFREDQKADLELFISHKQPRLEISTWQKSADAISLATLLGSTFYLFFAFIKGMVSVWQMNAR